MALDGGQERKIPQWRWGQEDGPMLALSSYPRTPALPSHLPSAHGFAGFAPRAVWGPGPGGVAHSLLPHFWASPPSSQVSHSVDQQTLSRMIIETNLLATVAQARHLQWLDQHTQQVGDSEDSMGSEAWMRERNSSLVSPSPSSSSLDQAPSKMIASIIYGELTKCQTWTQPSRINSVGPHHFGGYLRCRGFQLHVLGHPARK